MGTLSGVFISTNNILFNILFQTNNLTNTEIDAPLAFCFSSSKVLKICFSIATGFERQHIHVNPGCCPYVFSSIVSDQAKEQTVAR